MNETEQLAEFIAGLRFNDLSPEAIANAKLAIIDTVGVATFGSTLPWSQIVADVGQDFGATGKSSIWGRGWQTAPSIAALVNGTAAHAVEMDDRHHNLNIHNGGATVPAAIALAELTGASGRELVLAVACGYEVAFRVARASMKTITKFYWVSIRNIWGSVGASAKILGLDKRHMMSAFGIAGGMASGLWEFKNDPFGTMSKRVQGGGWPSQSGVMAALLAERGLTGPGTILEGEYGLLNSFSSEDPKPAALVDGLGDGFEMVHFETKAYATVGGYGVVVEAARSLRDEHGVTPDQVEHLSVGSSEGSVWHSAKDTPESIMAAQNHLVFVAAAALTYDLRDPSVWTEDLLRDPLVMGLLASSEMVVDDEIDEIAKTGKASGARVTMRLKDGRTVSSWVRTAKGNPGNLMTAKDIDGKFRLLVGKVLSAEQTEALRDYLDGLDGDPKPVSMAGYGRD